ncbi:hypothetical protein ABPG74_013540 [Tetrahymena malaccensis]
MASKEIWLEKYRPRTLDEVQGNEDALIKLRTIAEEGNVPNMILVGPPGIGKTSSVLCLARTLLADVFDSCALEMNASDERGIDVVREKIKSFAQKKVNLKPGLHKIIILDEADSLTEGAQQALRMIISDFADTTRFVLSCNDSSKLIDAIQSRCAILRFTKLTDEQVLRRLEEIVEKENINIDKGGKEALLFTCEGDMRQAINNLQATHTAFKLVNKENVLKVCDVPNVEVLQQVIAECVNGNFHAAQKKLYPLWEEGYTAYDLVNNLYKLIQTQDMDKQLQYEFMREMAFLKMKVLEGLPTFLQISGYLAKISSIANSKKQN